MCGVRRDVAWWVLEDILILILILILIIIIINIIITSNNLRLGVDTGGECGQDAGVVGVLQGRAEVRAHLADAVDRRPPHLCVRVRVRER
jgi:hypothetical protein